MSTTTSPENSKEHFLTTKKAFSQATKNKKVAAVFVFQVSSKLTEEIMFSREESVGKSGGRMLSHWENPKVPRWGRGKIPKCRRSDIAHLENPLKQVAGQGRHDSSKLPPFCHEVELEIPRYTRSLTKHLLSKARE